MKKTAFATALTAASLAFSGMAFAQNYGGHGVTTFNGSSPVDPMTGSTTTVAHSTRKTRTATALATSKSAAQAPTTTSAVAAGCRGSTAATSTW